MHRKKPGDTQEVPVSAIDRALKEKSHKHIYLDVLRVFAMFCVIVSNSDAHGLFAGCPRGSVSYWICLLVSILSSSMICIFFMIIGAEQLKREEKTEDIWKHKIPRIAIDIFVFSLLYYLGNVASGQETFRPGNFLLDLYSQERVIPFWFLYAYLGILICLPFLRPMARYIKNRDYVYLIGLAVILLNALPIVNEYILLDRYSLNPSMRLDWIMEMTVLYPLLGHFIRRRLSLKECKRTMVSLWILNLFWIVMTAYRTYVATEFSESTTIFTNYHTQVRLLNSLAVFMTARVLLDDREFSEKVKRFWSEFGGLTLGIYLFHVAFMERIPALNTIKTILMGSRTGIPALLCSLLWSVIVMALSAALTWILKKIPLVRKLF